MPEQEILKINTVFLYGTSLIVWWNVKGIFPFGHSPSPVSTMSVWPSWSWSLITRLGNFCKCCAGLQICLTVREKTCHQQNRDPEEHHFASSPLSPPYTASTEDIRDNPLANEFVFICCKYPMIRTQDSRQGGLNLRFWIESLGVKIFSLEEFGIKKRIKNF